MADSDALWSALGIGQLPLPSETRILTFGSSGMRILVVVVKNR
jgi:hypothetical protein